MPAFVVNTNVERGSVPANFILELSKVIGEATGKPESYVAVQLNPDQIMSFGGSTEPCAICTLGNIGRVNNKELSKVAMEKIGKGLNIPADRIYIFFSNLNGGEVGYNKSTF